MRRTPELPWLETKGNRIVRADTGEDVVLRGINRSGLEYAEPGERGFLAAAAITWEDVREMVEGWGARILRLPFNQDWVLRGRGEWSGEDYCAALDQVVAWAGRLGAYTLLDLQWLDADAPRGTNTDGTANFVPSLPSLDSLAAWQTLAARYRDVPAVLYDIFNEPHDPRPDDPTALQGIDADGCLFPLPARRVTMEDWQAWARHLVRSIRSEHPRALVFVSGVDWGYDLRGMPLAISAGSAEMVPSLVYSSHVYPWAGRHGGWLRARRWPRRLGGAPLSWEEAFGQLARQVPVFVAECGGGTEHRRWAIRLLRYLREIGVGWAAWSWCDRPFLRAGPDTTEPSEFGAVVRAALTERG